MTELAVLPIHVPTIMFKLLLWFVIKARGDNMGEIWV